ncbi:MAG: hypothetical protein ACLGIF_05630, partial [Actinomycetes bacterium]
MKVFLVSVPVVPATSGQPGCGVDVGADQGRSGVAEQLVDTLGGTAGDRWSGTGSLKGFGFSQAVVRQGLSGFVDRDGEQFKAAGWVAVAGGVGEQGGGCDRQLVALVGGRCGDDGAQLPRDSGHNMRVPSVEGLAVVADGVGNHVPGERRRYAERVE